ncbi:glycosyltransferase family 2 protein [Cohnella nanjingensis]|uniref:glycosyltransferase family 2 protein n=1 Tax=Cohnella nanjingensis TaxID=1387779 RepID=UPI0028AA160B|nr:glycosyltransferase [Cohnella nanjingensis]
MEAFLEKLDLQTHRDFELILVDQNEDERLLPLIRKYESRFPLLRLRSERGLSRARNVGIRRVTGDIVTFPDDDCWYDPGVLAQAVALFDRHPAWDIVTGRSVDAGGRDANGKFDLSEGYVDKRNVWRRAVSFTIFLRRAAVERIGDFDEEIGVGASSIYLSGEETDYLLRALDHCKVYYYPNFTVNHPNPLLHYTPQIINRAYRYGCGFGKVVRKHNYTIRFKAAALARPFIGMMIFCTAGQFPKSQYYWNSFKGRLRGML